VCVIDHLHRDLAVANDARRGRFTHAGVTLDLGRRPDWCGGGLADDEEWRIEWVKLYEGLDLAHAFVVTGERDHLSTWEDLVESFCEQVPVGFDTSDVSARRIQNWIYAWQRAAAAPHPGAPLRDGVLDVVVTRLIDDVTHLREHLTPERNHRTLELYALLIAALALPTVVDADGSLAAFALAELRRNCLTDIWTDGTHRECSTDYHHIVLRSLLGSIANARRFALDVPDDLVERVGRACDWAMHVQRPDGTIPSFSDGDNGDFGDVLTMAADLYQRDDLAWVASGGRRGAPPETTNVTFPIGGYVVQRSGWGAGARLYGDERFALLDCGPLGDGGHGHYDQLHVELVAGARVLAVDPGRYTYADGPWRRWFKGTAAHNTVTVDGADQTPYRKGRPKGLTSQARLVGRVAAGPGGEVDVVVGRVESPSYDAVHTRRLAFCAGEYWIVHDQLRAAGAHRYDVRWHLMPGEASAVQIDRHDGFVAVRSPWATYVNAGAQDVAIAGAWVSPTYGVKHEAAVIVATATANDADIVTVVVPGNAAQIDHVDIALGRVEVVLRADPAASMIDTLTWTAAADDPVGVVRWSRRISSSWAHHGVGGLER
jgi:hypothetical protein